MALDFHNINTDELVFCLADTDFHHLLPIFSEFEHWTGIKIDQYSDTKLNNGNIKSLIKIIDKYIKEKNLNENRLQTSTVIEFKGVLKYFLSNNIDVELLGD